jgi:uncharacterized OsmC-like protein
VILVDVPVLHADAATLPSEAGGHGFRDVVEGDIENVDGVIRITRIRVHYHLKIPAGTRDRAQRALDTHQSKCPAAVSVRDSIAIETSADVEEI